MCVELLLIRQGFEMGFDSKSNGGGGCIRIILRFIHGSIIARGSSRQKGQVGGGAFACAIRD